MAAGAVSLRKSHDIVILSFCNIVKGQAKYSKLETRKLILLQAVPFSSKQNNSFFIRSQGSQMIFSDFALKKQIQSGQI